MPTSSKSAPCPVSSVDLPLCCGPGPSLTDSGTASMTSLSPGWEGGGAWRGGWRVCGMVTACRCSVKGCGSSLWCDAIVRLEVIAVWTGSDRCVDRKCLLCGQEVIAVSFVFVDNSWRCWADVWRCRSITLILLFLDVCQVRSGCGYTGGCGLWVLFHCGVLMIVCVCVLVRPMPTCWCIVGWIQQRMPVSWWAKNAGEIPSGIRTEWCGFE